MSASLDDLIVGKFADDVVELCSGTAQCTIMAGYNDFGVAKIARALSERAEGVFYAVQFLKEVDFPGFAWVFVGGRQQRDLDIDDLWQFCSERGCGRCAPREAAMPRRA